MSKVIGVFSGKGGVGKTTSAVNIAAAMSYEFKKNVSLVDTNISSSAMAFHLGMHYNPWNINHVLRGEIPIDRAVEVHHSGMKVLPASIKLRDSFTKQNRLPNIIKYLKTHSDYVLLDTAPSIGEETLWALSAADAGMVITTPETPAIIEAIKLSRLTNEYGVKLLGVIVNKYKKGSIPLSKIANLCNTKILGVIPFDKNIRQSIEKNVPIVHHRPYSKASLSYKAIAAKISKERYKPSIFDKILCKLS